jgi:flavodoxin
MTALVVCVSISEGNTRQVAEAIGEVLGAAVVEPEEIAPNEVAGYELVGIGSGIYGMMFHARLWRFARSLPKVQGTPAFLFATSGGPEPLWRPAVLVLSRLLRSKGYRVVGTFSCPGFDNLGPFQLVGGLNKGRPNGADLAAAREFASQLQGDKGRAAATKVRAASKSRGAVAKPSSSGRRAAS